MAFHRTTNVLHKSWAMWIPTNFRSAIIKCWYHSMKSSWWRHQMETFSALLAICAGNSPVPSEFPTQRPVTRSFDIFFDLRLNKRLSKQRWGWWFETLSRPLWRRRNGMNGVSHLGSTSWSWEKIHIFIWVRHHSIYCNSPPGHPSVSEKEARLGRLCGKPDKSRVSVI